MQLAKYLAFDTILKSSNLVEEMDVDDVKLVGETIRQNYMADKQSRAEWEDRYAEAQKRVMQLVEEKTWPWPKASNIKFPLITVATLQYHARAYPALVPSGYPVKCRVIGDDPKGEKAARAKRVSGHMSFQVMEEDAQWEDSTDKALIVQAIMGCAFKKTYSSSSRHCVVSELVMPKDLVINYYAKSLDTAPRITHVLGFSRDEIEERVRRGLFARRDDSTAPVDINDPENAAPRGMPPQGVIEDAENDIAGIQRPAVDDDTPVFILEHHFSLDLDGDGMREPYIAFVREDDGSLYRLVARFEADKVERAADGQIVRIEPEQYFTKYEFIPAPDGSIYGMGFGMLLGSTNDAVDTAMNQMMDSGTMKNLGGGFLARGIRTKGSGEFQFKPGEWKRTDSNAEDLHKGVMPLPVGEPSSVMFQLLNLLIDWGSRVGMATDAATGQNPGQNQKVGTTEAVIKQGEKVFNGIYKRTYRALKKEFRLIFRLNYLAKPASGRFDYADDGGQGGFALWTDYFESNKSVVPAADPSIASREELVQRNMMVRQLSGTMPGYNRYAVERRLLESMEVPNIDEIFPKPGTPGAQQPSPPPNVMIAQIKAQIESKKIEAADRRHQLELMENARLNQAKILQLEAQALKLRADAGVAENSQILDLMDYELKAAQTYQQQLTGAIDGYSKIFEMQQAQGEGNGGDSQQGSVGSVAPAGGNGGAAGLPA